MRRRSSPGSPGGCKRDRDASDSVGAGGGRRRI